MIGPLLVDRRRTLGGTLAAFVTCALLREVRAAAAIPPRRMPATLRLARQQDLAAALRDGSLSGSDWHDAINKLAAEVDIAELVAEAQRGRISDTGPPFMRDPVKRRIQFVDANGVPRSLGYGAAFFVFAPGKVITPHAHRHMASAHMVVEGRVRIRTFDRIGESDGAIVIRQTRDEIGAVGTAAAMTTERDNIHWFVPATPRATTFDIVIDGLDPGAEDYVIEPVDPLGGELRGDGTIVAPVIGFEASMQRYPASR